MISVSDNTKIHKRIEWIALVQIMSMILIVAHHSVSKYCQYPSYIPELHTTFSYVGLTAFMFVSGYLLSTSDSLQKYGYVQFVKRRALRLLIPCFIVQSGLFLPKLVVICASNSLTADLTTELFNILLRPRFAVCPHLWFLPVLFILNITLPLYINILKHKIGCVVFLLASFLASNVDVPCGDILGFSDVKLYLFWYSLGISVAHYGLLDCFNKPELRRFVILLSLFLFVILKKLNFNVEYYGLCRIEYVFSILALIGTGIELESIHTGFSNLDKFTFPIYILSLPIQNVFEVLGRNCVHSWVVITTIMFVAGFIFPIVITLVVKRVEALTKTRFLSLCIGA